MIDTKNNKYVTRTVSVIIHLISRGEDIEGILNRLISYVKDNDITDQYLSLFEMNHYSLIYYQNQERYLQSLYLKFYHLILISLMK